MARGYAPGSLIGNFEVIEKTGSYLESNGAREGLYRVRCLRCGEEATMTSTYVRCKKDCGCSKQDKCRSAMKAAKPRLVRKKPEPWMDEGEIYRSWKESRDRALQYSVLAELNGVSVTVIEEIIRRRKEEDPLLQKI